jgi:hypothetical protein
VGRPGVAIATTKETAITIAHRNLPPATDIGPATPPPAWCTPGTQPSWDRLTDEHGGGTICTWTRNYPDAADADVWIQAEDQIVDGRIMRTEPRITVAERESVTPDEARRLAAALLNAADELDRMT